MVNEGSHIQMTESTTYLHNCTFCETTIAGATLEEVQEAGRIHLEEQHYRDFTNVFREKFGGKGCFDDCGYTYAGGGDPDAGFECPNCGYDNFYEFAERHIWWRAKVE